jgi:hypothetical protein
MRFAYFPNINSVLSNAADLRLYSLNEFGVPMGNRPRMTRRDVASELPTQGGKPRTPPARGPAVPESKVDLQLNFNDAG